MPQTNVVDTIRTAALTEVYRLAYRAVWTTQQPTVDYQAAVIVAFLDEAIAYWANEVGHGPMVEADYRQIAADLVAFITEQAPAIAAVAAAQTKERASHG
jgi:hypothetical protein